MNITETLLLMDGDRQTDKTDRQTDKTELPPMYQWGQTPRDIWLLPLCLEQGKDTER